MIYNRKHRDILCGKTEQLELEIEKEKLDENNKSELNMIRIIASVLMRSYGLV